MWRSWILSAAVALAFIAGAAACGEEERCGPARGTVARVIDGDTLELESGEKIRYLLVDTPESTTRTECYGAEAKAFNQSLVHGQEVELTYDIECRDRFDRLLAWVTVGGQDVNRLLIERGYACVLHISPNGDDKVDAYETLEQEAKDAGRGLWGACTPAPC